MHETVKRQEQLGKDVHWLPCDPAGLVNLERLETQLAQVGPSLVCVMIANNEVGTRQPVFDVAQLCREHGSLFLADGVQDVKTARALISEGLPRPMLSTR